MTPARTLTFEPRAILAALERSASYIIIGGLARVLRGADEVTTGLDLCPSPTAENLDRLVRGLTEMRATAPDRQLAPLLTPSVCLTWLARSRRARTSLTMASAIGRRRLGSA